MPLEIQAKIRYRQEPKPASLMQKGESRMQNEMIIEFKEKQWAIAP